MPFAPTHSDPGLLERDAEQASIEALLKGVAGGTGGVGVVQGPAGIGKTRLLTAAREAAGGHGLRVARARGGSLEQDFAYGAVRQLLEPLVGDAGDPETLFSGVAAAAAPVLGHAGIWDGAAPEPGPVLHGLYWLTVALAESSPMLLICDDAHWFDAPSLRFVSYLAHRVRELPVAIMIGTRPPEPGPEGELLERLVTDQGVMRLNPAPLSDGAVATLVRRSLDAPADDAFCRAVAEASRGNPFLVGELVRSADAAGIPVAGVGAARLTELSAGSAVLGRIGRLPSSALELARAAAVLGADAHVRHAAALASLDIDDALAAADLLLRADILGPDRPLTFVHPLVAQAVYSDLLPGERAARHRRAAQLLRAEGAPPGHVASHLLASEPIGDPDVVEVLRAAAGTALAQGATEVAISYLRRALAEPPALAGRLGVVLELGSAEAMAVDPGAIDHLGEAIEAIEDPGLRILLATARGTALVHHGRPREAIAALAALTDELPHGSDLRLEALAATVLVGMNGPAAAPLVSGQIAELRAAVGPSSDATPSVLGVRAFVGALANEPAEEMAAMASRALGAAEPDDPRRPFWFSLPLTALIMADRDAEAAAFIEQDLANARRVGAPPYVAVMLFQRGWLALRAGELADAEADARAALELLSMCRVPFIVPGPLAVLVDVLRERDDLAGAEAALAEWGYEHGDGDSIFNLFLLSARARLHSARERWDDAAADFERGIERSAANACASPGFIAWHSQYLLDRVMARQLGATARQLAATARRLGDEFGAPRARAEGLRATVVGDPTSDTALAEQAARLFASVGAKLEEARTMAAIEPSRRGHIPISESRQLLSRALDLAERSGSVRIARLVNGLLSEVGVEPRRRPASGLESLTPSERRVAALAAAGRTNKDVAQELYVSVKTVETHLAHVFQKLEISSRARLNSVLQPV